ncbi:MAG TPA: hypothetical protein VER55_10400, partial [Ardenticatenaceae bacterium]|nr:hypothetical protein [Ardenticatenaceae bacterium]
MTALGIGLAFMTLLPLGRVVPVGQHLLLPLIPVEGTGTYRAAFFAIHATLIGAPAALLLHYRYGIRPALLFALGFLAPLVSWAFWDIGYGLPFISPLVTWPLEALLPGTLALVLARAAAVVEGSSRVDGLARVTVAAALMTASALALSGIVAQRWLPPRAQLSYSASFGPAYLLVYGLAVAVLFL